MNFNWEYAYVSGNHGVQISGSIPNDGYFASTDGLNRQGISYFYIKTWLCPAGTFYDHTTSMCETCTILNCLACFTQAICKVCDSANLYYVIEENQTVPYTPGTVGTCAYCDPNNG